MKQRITVEDISTLNGNQKQIINDMWIPTVYDVAVASVCKDVENEEYENIVFVVGGIELYNKTRMILHDIRHIETEAEKQAEDNVEPIEEAEDEEPDFAELDDSEFEFSYTQPTSFNKEDCIPLLTIGQLIQMLEKRGFGYGDFYLSVGINDIGCTIGNEDFNMNNYGIDYEKRELCDVLWEYLKSVLE